MQNTRQVPVPVRVPSTSKSRGCHFYAEHVPAARIIRLNLGFSPRTPDRSLKHLQGNSGPI